MKSQSQWCRCLIVDQNLKSAGPLTKNQYRDVDDEICTKGALDFGWKHVSIATRAPGCETEKQVASETITAIHVYFRYVPANQAIIQHHVLDLGAASGTQERTAVTGGERLFNCSTAQASTPPQILSLCNYSKSSSRFWRLRPSFSRLRPPLPPTPSH